MSDRFLTVFVFLLLVLHSDNSLFSRFRNPNEFVAPADSLAPDDVDAETYAGLLEEIPELRSQREGTRLRPRDPLRMPYLKYNLQHSDEYDFMTDGAPLHHNHTEAMATATSSWDVSAGTYNASNVSSTSTIASDGAGDGSHRRWYHLYWTGPWKATCYCCNLSGHRHIPASPLCHDAWDSPDWQARTLARYFRCRCYYNKYHWGSQIETKWKHDYHYTHDRGLARGYYGYYMGGCFKRFLDVGKVYTARGCRSDLPRSSSGFASHRFRKLELLLLKQRDACVSSPHASLTPFSRAVSLYVRYHVCVCDARYCNRAPPPPRLASAASAACALLLYVVL